MSLPKSPTQCLAPTSGHGVQMTKDGPHKVAEGDTVIRLISPLNVLKDTYDHSCY